MSSHNIASHTFSTKEVSAQLYWPGLLVLCQGILGTGGV